jgi:hypothetical protein
MFRGNLQDANARTGTLSATQIESRRFVRLDTWMTNPVVIGHVPREPTLAVGSASRWHKDPQFHGKCHRPEGVGFHGKSRIPTARQGAGLSASVCGGVVRATQPPTGTATIRRSDTRRPTPIIGSRLIKTVLARRSIVCPGPDTSVSCVAMSTLTYCPSSALKDREFHVPSTFVVILRTKRVGVVNRWGRLGGHPRPYRDILPRRPARRPVRMRRAASR